MLSLVNSVIMTLFASIIFISFYQIIIVHGEDIYDTSMDESLPANSDPDAGFDTADDIPADFLQQIRDTFGDGGVFRVFGEMRDMISDESRTDDGYEFNLSPNVNLFRYQVLLSQIRNLNQIRSVKLSFHSQDDDIIRDPFGNPLEYTSSRQDLGHVLDILHQGFTFAYAKCVLTLLPNSNFDPHTLFFHFAQSSSSSSSSARNNTIARITGPTLFSIDGTGRRYNVSIDCPTGLTCMWLLNKEVIFHSADSSVSLTFEQRNVGNRTLSYVGYRGNKPRHLASLLLSILPSTINSTRTVCNSLPQSPNNVWLPAGSMSRPRIYFTATYLPTSAKIMITGGTSDGLTALSSFDIYDPNTGCYNTSNMTAPRMQHAAAYYNNSDIVLLIGGARDANNLVGPSELISINAAQSYSSIANPRSLHTIAMLNDSNILIVAGRTLGNGSLPFEIYNRTSSVFQTLLFNQSQLSNLTGHSATSLGNSETVLIFGGYNGTAYYGTGLIADMDNMTEYAADDPDSIIISGRAHHQATYIPQLDAVLITGGDNGITTFKDCYLYYSSSRTFNRTNDMISPRSFHAAALHSNGSVLIIGGALEMLSNQPINPTFTVERFDPNTLSFTQVASLQVRRYGHLAVVLPNGEVFVFGGRDIDGRIISNIEYIMPQQNVLA